MSRRYQAGQLVRVSIPESGADPIEGVILQARKPRALPIAGKDVELLAAIMRAVRVRQVLLLDLGEDFEHIAFALDELIVDLNGHEITLEVIK